MAEVYGRSWMFSLWDVERYSYLSVFFPLVLCVPFGMELFCHLSGPACIYMPCSGRDCSSLQSMCVSCVRARGSGSADLEDTLVALAPNIMSNDAVISI